MQSQTHKEIRIPQTLSVYSLRVTRNKTSAYHQWYPQHTPYTPQCIAVALVWCPVILCTCRCTDTLHVTLTCMCRCRCATSTSPREMAQWQLQHLHTLLYSTTLAQEITYSLRLRVRFGRYVHVQMEQCIGLMRQCIRLQDACQQACCSSH